MTASVLVHLLDTVEILEPAPHFLAEAVKQSEGWKGLKSDKGDVLEEGVVGKAVRFWEGGLAGFDPSEPGATAKETSRRGVWKETVREDALALQYDV